MTGKKRFWDNGHGWTEEETRLKDYKGFHIYKEVKKYKGVTKERWYGAWDSNDDILDSKLTLPELKAVVDAYVG